MLYITVPDMNDSVSSLTIADKEYLIRFTYNGKLNLIFPRSSSDTHCLDFPILFPSSVCVNLASLRASFTLSAILIVLVSNFVSSFQSIFYGHLHNSPLILDCQ